MSTKSPPPQRSTTRTLGFWEILKIDDPSLALVVVIIFALLVAFITKTFGITIVGRRTAIAPNDIPAQIYTIIYGVIVIVCAVILAWRIYFVKRLCRNAIEIIGNVTSVAIIGNTTRLHYEYRVEGRNYTAKISASIFHPARQLKVGEPILLLVNRSNPKQTLALG
jgi:hypothetical protein